MIHHPSKGISVDVAEETRGGVMEIGRTRIHHLSDVLERWKEILKNAKIITPTTLFDVEPDWRALFEEHRCPFCGLGLRFARTRPIARCGRKKCCCPTRGGFVIRIAVLKGTLKIN